MPTHELELAPADSPDMTTLARVDSPAIWKTFAEQLAEMESMATIHADVEQYSLPWVMLRLGKPTASEFDSLMTPLFAAKKGAGPETYLCKKLAEKWQGHALPGFNSFATEQGSLLEDEALPWLAMEMDCDVRQVGFIESDDKRCGCSPDGLIGEDAGVEIKCPQAETHVKYLRAGEVPDDYMAQVHGSLYVSGRKRWHFVSYRRGFPKLVVTVERDEAIMAKIDAALKAFYRTFDAAFEELHERK